MNHNVMQKTLIAGAAALALGQPAAAAEESGKLSRAQLEGIELEYEVGGNANGDTVLLIHAGVFHDWWAHWWLSPRSRSITAWCGTTASAMAVALGLRDP